jgi:hypothetical protein
MRQEQAVAHVIEVATIACSLCKREDMRACSVPLFYEPLALPVERLVKRLEESGSHAVEALSKCQAEGELIPTAQVQLPDQRDIAIFGCVELPIHLEIVRQVCPSIAGPDVSARAPQKWHRGPKRKPCSLLVGRENLLPRDLSDLPIVAPAPDLNVWGKQSIELHWAEESRLAFETGVDEHRVLMRIADQLLHNAVAPLRVGTADTEAQRMMREAFNLMFKVALLLVKKRLAISDQVLQVANLRTVDGRVIHLVEYAVGDGVPDAAR